MDEVMAYEAITSSIHARGDNRSIFQVQPAQLLRRQFDLQRGERGARLREQAWADQREGREGLTEHISQRDIDRQNTSLLCHLIDALQPSEIIFAIPATYQFRVRVIFRVGSPCKEPSRLTGPWHQRHSCAGKPGPRLRIRGRDTASPDRIDHTSQAKVIAHRGKTGHPMLNSPPIGSFHALNRPVRGSKEPHTPGILMLVEDRDKFTYRHIYIIAMQHIDINIVGLQAFQALPELLIQPFGCAVWRMGPFIQDDHLLAYPPIVDPLPQQFLTATAPIDIGGIKAVATALEEVIKHDSGMRPGLLIIDSQDQSRDRLIQARDPTVLHG